MSQNQISSLVTLLYNLSIFRPVNLASYGLYLNVLLGLDEQTPVIIKQIKYMNGELLLKFEFVVEEEEQANALPYLFENASSFAEPNVLILFSCIKMSLFYL